MAFPDLTYITNESFQMNMTFIQINAAQIETIKNYL